MLFLGQASNYHAKDILRHTFSFGTKTDAQKLRSHLAKRYNVDKDNIALFGTGRSALAMAIKLTVKDAPSQKTKKPKNARLDPESLLHPKVIITALTCYAVVEAIRAADCTPIFADVDPKTLHFGPTQLKKTLLVHPDAKAIIIQNNLGHPVDIKKLETLAKKHKLTIIEDLAHCTGVFYPDGREAGTIGDATILSFGKGKSIDTIAGGALVLRSPRPSTTLPQPSKRPSLPNSLRARFYPLFGAMIRGFYHLHLGRYFTSFLLKIHFIQRSADAPLNFETRCTYWQAKLALRQLENLPRPRPPLREFYLVNDRDATLDKLEKNGIIFNDTWYDCPVAPERYFAKSGFDPKSCPVAVELAQKIINFPTHYPKSRLKTAKSLIKNQIISPSNFKPQEKPHAH